MLNCRIMKLYIFFVATILLFSGCLRVKSTSTRVNKYYESFFVSDSIDQYYIKPMILKNKKESIAIDFTYRSHKTTINSDSSYINFTLISSSKQLKIDSVCYNNSQTSFTSIKNKFIYTSAHGKMYNSRFTSGVPSVSVSKLFANEGWTIRLFLKNGGVITFIPNAGIAKRIRKLNNVIFSEN